MPLHDDLETSVAKVEQRIGTLGVALQAHAVDAVEREAAELQRALAAAVDHMRRSARAGELTPQLRQRLALASGHVAAQRESLARATAALDRAIDVLLPAATPRGAYAASGLAERQTRSGVVQA